MPKGREVDRTLRKKHRKKEKAIKAKRKAATQTIANKKK